MSYVRELYLSLASLKRCQLKKNSKTKKTLRLFQGPTGVSGPKGARGAQGPPVSDTSYTMTVVPSYTMLFALTKPLSLSFRAQLVSPVLLVGSDLRVPM